MKDKDKLNRFKKYGFLLLIRKKKEELCDNVFLKFLSVF